MPVPSGKNTPTILELVLDELKKVTFVLLVMTATGCTSPVVGRPVQADEILKHEIRDGAVYWVKHTGSKREEWLLAMIREYSADAGDDMTMTLLKLCLQEHHTSEFNEGLKTLPRDLESLPPPPVPASPTMAVNPFKECLVSVFSLKAGETDRLRQEVELLREQLGELKKERLELVKSIASGGTEESDIEAASLKAETAGLERLITLLEARLQAALEARHQLEAEIFTVVKSLTGGKRAFHLKAGE